MRTIGAIRKKSEKQKATSETSEHKAYVLAYDDGNRKVFFLVNEDGHNFSKGKYVSTEYGSVEEIYDDLAINRVDIDLNAEAPNGIINLARQQGRFKPNQDKIRRLTLEERT